MGLVDKAVAVGLNMVISTSGNSNMDLLVKKIANWVGAIAGVIAFFYLVYSGFIYLTAGGNADAAKKGGQGIINAIIGLAIIALAYALVAAVVGILD